MLLWCLLCYVQKKGGLCSSMCVCVCCSCVVCAVVVGGVGWVWSPRWLCAWRQTATTFGALVGR